MELDFRPGLASQGKPLNMVFEFILPEVASTDIRFQKQSMFSSISRSLVASNSCEICC